MSVKKKSDMERNYVVIPGWTYKKIVRNKVNILDTILPLVGVVPQGLTREDVCDIMNISGLYIDDSGRGELFRNGVALNASGMKSAFNPGTNYSTVMSSFFTIDEQFKRMRDDEAVPQWGMEVDKLKEAVLTRLSERVTHTKNEPAFFFVEQKDVTLIILNEGFLHYVSNPKCLKTFINQCLMSMYKYMSIEEVSQTQIFKKFLFRTMNT